MTFTCKIKMDNAAFDGAPFLELERALQQVADNVPGYGNKGTIRDANGSRIGEWAIEGSRSDDN